MPEDTGERHARDSTTHSGGSARAWPRVLFVSAETAFRAGIDAGGEFSKIKAAIGAKGVLLSAFQLPPGKLVETLDAERPHVLHFTGHAEDGNLVFRKDESGAPAYVSAEGLQECLRKTTAPLRLVVLNACESDELAQAAADVVGLAVGTAAKLPVADADDIAAALHRGLCDGKTPESAVAAARNTVAATDAPLARSLHLKVGEGHAGKENAALLSDADVADVADVAEKEDDRGPSEKHLSIPSCAAVFAVAMTGVSFSLLNTALPTPVRIGLLVLCSTIAVLAIGLAGAWLGPKFCFTLPHASRVVVSAPLLLLAALAYSIAPFYLFESRSGPESLPGELALIVRDPRDGAMVGDSVPIRGSSVSVPGQTTAATRIKIEFLRPGGQRWEAVQTLFEAGEFSASLPPGADGAYTVRFTASRDQVESRVVEHTIHRDTSPPEISILEPTVADYVASDGVSVGYVTTSHGALDVRFRVKDAHLGPGKPTCTRHDPSTASTSETIEDIDEDGNFRHPVQVPEAAWKPLSPALPQAVPNVRRDVVQDKDVRLIRNWIKQGCERGDWGKVRAVLTRLREQRVLPDRLVARLLGSASDDDSYYRSLVAIHHLDPIRIEKKWVARRVRLIEPKNAECNLIRVLENKGPLKGEWALPSAELVLAAEDRGANPGTLRLILFRVPAPEPWRTGLPVAAGMLLKDAWHQAHHALQSVQRLNSENGGPTLTPEDWQEKLGAILGEEMARSKLAAHDAWARAATLKARILEPDLSEPVTVIGTVLRVAGEVSTENEFDRIHAWLVSGRNGGPAAAGGSVPWTDLDGLEAAQRGAVKRGNDGGSFWCEFEPEHSGWWTVVVAVVREDPMDDVRLAHAGQCLPLSVYVVPEWARDRVPGPGPDARRWQFEGASANSRELPLGFVDALKQEFLYVPPPAGGAFEWGSRFVDKSSHGEEKGEREEPEDRTRAILREGYYLQRREVTNEAYAEYLRRTGQDAEHESGAYLGQSLAGDEQPVVRVTLREGREFAAWLSKMSGGRWRFSVPAEEQWEHAAWHAFLTVLKSADPEYESPESQGDWEKKYLTQPSEWPPSGGLNVADRRHLDLLDGEDNLVDDPLEDWSERRLVNTTEPDHDKLHWQCWGSVDDGHAVSRPVGEGSASVLGMWDLWGNVSEWCDGPFHGDDTDEFTLRGASWATYKRSILPTFRVPAEPGKRYRDVGIRLVAVPR